LAVILYEAITGKLPFNAQTPMEYIQKHVLESPIPISQRSTDVSVPTGLESVIDKALAKKPEDRWQSAAEFATALHSVLVGTSAEAASAGALSLLPPMPSLPASAAGPGAVGDTPKTRFGSTRLLALALSFVAVGAILALLVLRWLPR
jgi:serine/threonine-protein kinase